MMADVNFDVSKDISNILKQHNLSIVGTKEHWSMGHVETELSYIGDIEESFFIIHEPTEESFITEVVREFDDFDFGDYCKTLIDENDCETLDDIDYYVGVCREMEQLFADIVVELDKIPVAE